MAEFNPDDYTEEELQQIYAAGVVPEEMGVLGQQLKQANLMRNRGMPEGRQTQNAYVAANPLEFLGAYMQHRKGEKESKDILSQMGQATDRMRQGRMAGMMPRASQPLDKMQLDPEMLANQASAGVGNDPTQLAAPQMPMQPKPIQQSIADILRKRIPKAKKPRTLLYNNGIP